MGDNNFAEFFDCPICSEPYSNSRKAIILNCSHTLCHICLENLKKRGRNTCPTCNTTITRIQNNTIIMRLSKSYKLFNNCTNNFLNFHLRFKYCVNCRKFITNYSFLKHKKDKHKLFTFDKVLQSYFEKLDNVFDKDMFIVLYFYLNPFLFEIKYLNDEKGKTFSLANDKYTFCTKMESIEDNEFLMNLMKNKYNDPNYLRWHKGILINKKDLLFIHGYFAIKSEQFIPYIQPNIFGFLFYDEIAFFGLIKVNKNSINKNDSLENKDFILDCGLLYYQNNYYFGKFNEINISDLNTKNNIENENLKIINEGEILYIKDQGVELKTIEDKKIVSKLPIITIQLIDQSKLYVNIEDIYGKTEMEIEPFNKKINEISIPFEEYDLQNCKINFMKYNRILILKRDNYTIYIYKNDNRNQIENNGFKTKILSINLIKDVHTIVNLSTSKINQIQKQNNEFYLSLKELLKRNIETTQIKYFECEINNGKINLNKNIYYEISGNKATRINNINLNENELTQEDNTLNGIQKIEDFLKIELTSEFYKFKEKRSKEEQIFCKCNLI